MFELPAHFIRFREEFPTIAQAYDALGDAVHSAGSLDDQTRQLVKLALAIGARLEGATHAHVRRALEMGISPEAIKHVALLAITTLGYPTAMSAYAWINDILDSR
ncbi:MAG: carboxymuconolactone decarboxylase family protein [Anaerolineae bacterium]|nr:carboxymuconolactone decarboxylase family protein [Anaerolineae bacterium]MDW8300245.1 carboxymuconolactone decarboxylase family protein [Anaerolineae bacterium]